MLVRVVDIDDEFHDIHFISVIFTQKYRKCLPMQISIIIKSKFILIMNNTVIIISYQILMITACSAVSNFAMCSSESTNLLPEVHREIITPSDKSSSVKYK